MTCFLRNSKITFAEMWQRRFSSSIGRGSRRQYRVVQRQMPMSSVLLGYQAAHRRPADSAIGHPGTHHRLQMPTAIAEFSAANYSNQTYLIC